MTDFKIVVCMKVVPKPEEIRVDPETRRLERSQVRSEFNPPDMNALEMALRLKDLYNARVIILSMGPAFFEPYLRIGLAMGADEAFLLSDRRFAGADTLATTYTLAKGIEKLGHPDLIICGEESSDGATGQVPPGLAEWLGIPQITLVTDIEMDLEQRVVRGRREVRGGHEMLEVPTPAVISVKTASNEPRFMDYEIKDKAFKQTKIGVWSCEDIEADEGYIGVPGSPTIVTGFEQATIRERKREFLPGARDEVVRRLLESIQDYL
ncbi:MAG TPA: electron transfer flavoprotein subunit beta/FixA family protein [Anaerolineae bacterium]|nr:electron transfer flavoprotein subunit beta/FixA family protein [Anaerolineae bacterium]